MDVHVFEVRHVAAADGTCARCRMWLADDLEPGWIVDEGIHADTGVRMALAISTRPADPMQRVGASIDCVAAPSWGA